MSDGDEMSAGSRGSVANDWILVAERTPAPQVNVLLAKPCDSQYGRFRIMRFIDQGYEQYWADDIGYTSPINAYSHWMPLPAPPADDK
jgi:hypothetical protein